MRKKILYLGLDLPPPASYDGELLHYPIIRVVARPVTSPDVVAGLQDFALYTHLIFTSKTAIRLLHSLNLDFANKQILCVGQRTASLLPIASQIAAEETAEGLVKLLKTLDLKEAYLFWPHSALSRSVLPDFFNSQSLRWRECILYDTVAQAPDARPDLSAIDQIVFTSPSCVDAFLQLFGQLPKDKILTAIGPVTEARLKEVKTEKLLANLNLILQYEKKT